MMRREDQLKTKIFFADVDRKNGPNQTKPNPMPLILQINDLANNGIENILVKNILGIRERERESEMKKRNKAENQK